MFNVITSQKKVSNKIVEIHLTDIRQVLWRRFQLIDCACEVFTNANLSYFFFFECPEDARPERGRLLPGSVGFYYSFS
jgi:hypothetical protein